MEYTKRTVRSRPGLTQEAALDSLQSHSEFRTGTKIATIRRRGKVWVADLLEPKVAGPFPPDDEGPEESSESAPPEESEGPPSEGDSEESSDSPDSPEGGGGPPKPGGGEDKPGGGKGNTDVQILHTLQQILHALQGGPVEDGLGGPDDLGPDLGGPPGGPGGPPGGPGAGGLPPGGPKGPGSSRPLKPGEVPNKPGSVPVGAPSFSHTRRRAEVTPMTPELQHALQICESQGFAVLGPDGQPVGAFQPGAGGARVGPGNTQPAPPEVEQAANSYQGRRQAAPSVPPTAPAAGGPPVGAQGAGVAGGPSATPMGGGTCPKCGQQEPCSCGYGQQASPQQASPVVGRAATFVARRTANVTVKQAKAELEAEYGPHGYKVARIKRDGNVLRALITRR